MTNHYRIEKGTVQPFISGFTTSPYIQHFGRAEYDRNKPILSNSLLSQATPIVNDLNLGNISEKEARKKLQKIWM